MHRSRFSFFRGSQSNLRRSASAAHLHGTETPAIPGMDALLNHVAAAIVIRVVIIEIVIRPEPDAEAAGKEPAVMEAVTEARVERTGCKAASLNRGKAVGLRPGNADSARSDRRRAREAVAEVSTMRGACTKISACAGAGAPTTAGAAPTSGVAASAPTAASTPPAA